MKNYDIIVIGAGSSGLVIAIGGKKAGKKVLLIEKGLFGGDCTNFGCIPSKSIIASAKTCHTIQSAQNMGVDLSQKEFRTDKVFQRISAIVEKVRKSEDANALRAKGIDVIQGAAEFIDSHTIKAENQTVQGKHVVIATGSRAKIPSIERVQDTPFLTNETIFDLNMTPKSLIVMGGGPIGCELAQAFQRMGTKVTLIHTHDTLLKREPPFAGRLLKEVLEEEKIELLLNFRTNKINFKENQFFLELQNKLEKSIKTITGEKLLICIGRQANVQNLNLEKAGVKYSEKGISVDRYNRTSQKHIFAIGDVIGPPFFTHFAEYQARCVLKTLLIPFFRKKILPCILPRVTFTDPEIASVGIIEGKNVIDVFLSEVDRAVTDSKEKGQLRIVTKKFRSKILGACIVAPKAGEMLAEILIAMNRKIPLRHLSNIIHPYPTYNLAIRKAADLWLANWIHLILRKK